MYYVFRVEFRIYTVQKVSQDICLLAPDLRAKNYPLPSLSLFLLFSSFNTGYVFVVKTVTQSEVQQGDWCKPYEQEREIDAHGMEQGNVTKIRHVKIVANFYSFKIEK